MLSASGEVKSDYPENEEILGRLTSAEEIYVTHKGYEFSINKKMQVILIGGIGNSQVSKKKYTITRNITNGSSNKEDTEIEENKEYTENITVNSGYVITNVTVTMGGTDITNPANKIDFM